MVNTPEWSLRCARRMLEHGYDLLTPRIDDARNSLMTYLLGIRIDSRTMGLAAERPAPGVNMERHIFTLSKRLEFRIGEVDRNAYSILHRLFSKESEFESLAATFPGEPPVPERPPESAAISRSGPNLSAILAGLCKSAEYFDHTGYTARARAHAFVGADQKAAADVRSALEFTTDPRQRTELQRMLKAD